MIDGDPNSFPVTVYLFRIAIPEDWIDDRGPAGPAWFAGTGEDEVEAETNALHVASRLWTIPSHELEVTMQAMTVVNHVTSNN